MKKKVGMQNIKMALKIIATSNEASGESQSDAHEERQNSSSYISLELLGWQENSFVLDGSEATDG